MSSVQTYFNDIESGMNLPVLAKTPTTRQLVMYAGASGDFYEVHYDIEFARARDLSGVIVHGALKSGFIGQLLSDWAGIEGTIKRLDIQYRSMDVANSTMWCKGIVRSKQIVDGKGIVECDVWIENASGEKTTAGSASILLPIRV